MNDVQAKYNVQFLLYCANGATGVMCHGLQITKLTLFYMTASDMLPSFNFKHM